MQFCTSLLGSVFIATHVKTAIMSALQSSKVFIYTIKCKISDKSVALKGLICVIVLVTFDISRYFKKNKPYITLVSSVTHVFPCKNLRMNYLVRMQMTRRSIVCEDAVENFWQLLPPLSLPCTVNKSISNLRNRKPDGLPTTSPGQPSLRSSSATVPLVHAAVLWRHAHSTSSSMND